MSSRRCAVPLACVMLAASATAQVTTTVVDLPTRGVMQRILYVKPDAPTANIVALPGGNGLLRIRDDGSMASATCFPLARTRQALAAQGFAVALVDMASDGSTQNFDDVSAVIRYMRERADVPTWIIGGSSSAQGAWNMAVALPPSSPVGIVFFSPDIVDTSQQALYRRPTLVVIHPLDRAQYSGLLFPALALAPVAEAVSIPGGSSGGCGYHLFQGLDAEFAAAVAGFITKHNGSFPPATTTATAVEFHNAALDHYFVTHLAGEIGILDAGVTIKGWARTGESFAVYPGAQPGSSAVCRFYIPPAKGDSHFYGRGSVECDATGAGNPTFVNEDPQFFHVMLPAAGVCPTGTNPIYRAFSNRADANHRYMVSRALRDQMAASGWLAEGDGPDKVVMCSPQ